MYSWTIQSKQRHRCCRGSWLFSGFQFPRPVFRCPFRNCGLLRFQWICTQSGQTRPIAYTRAICTGNKVACRTIYAYLYRYDPSGSKLDSCAKIGTGSVAGPCGAQITYPIHRTTSTDVSYNLAPAPWMCPTKPDGMEWNVSMIITMDYFVGSC